jgi:hypothetical protein
MGLTAAFLLSFLLVFAFSPHFHDSHAGIRQNESALGSLRKIQPIARGLTGVRAFCTDESGTLFYEENGSATACLSARLPLF